MYRSRHRLENMSHHSSANVEVCLDSSSDGESFFIMQEPSGKQDLNKCESDIDIEGLLDSSEDSAIDIFDTVQIEGHSGLTDDHIETNVTARSLYKPATKDISGSNL